MSKYDEKYQKSSAKMVSALTELMKQKHFHEITVTDVCRTAGVQRSTFYAHYRNTAELLQETLEIASREFLSYWKESSLAEMEPPYLNARNLKPFLTYVESHRDTISIFFQESFPTLKRMILDWIIDNMTYPNTKGSGDRAYAEYVTLYYLSSIHTVIAHWLERDCAESIDRMCAIILACVNREEPEQERTVQI